MKKDIIVLKCNECGEDFLYEWKGRGAKPLYCEKCKPLVVARNKQKYIDKHKLFHYPKVQQSQEKEAKNIEKQVADTDYTKRLLELTRQLDTLRVSFCELATDLHQEQSVADKNDQYYMHSIENINFDDIEAVKTFVKDFKATRNSRRDVKTLINIVGPIIEAIPYKSTYNALSILKK